MYWLLTENYVLNANISVLMHTHTELFSNVSGLGLEKNFGPRPRPRPHSLASALASCPAGLVNITGSNKPHLYTLYTPCVLATASQAYTSDSRKERTLINWEICSKFCRKFGLSVAVELNLPIMETCLVVKALQTFVNLVSQQ